MNIVYTQADFPDTIVKSIMLCGPTPRDVNVISWRPEALKMLELLGYDGTVFVPEYRPKKNYSCASQYYDYDKQIKWEYDAMRMSDCVLFWVPRELNTMPAFTTNDEWGYLKESGKVVFGAPHNAPKTAYQKYFTDLFKVPSANTLIETVKNAMDKVSNGSLRIKGERNVPLMIWNTTSFQSWYNSHKAIGNYLQDAKLLWNFRARNGFVFAYTLWVSIWIEAEKRFKTNEFIFARTDICSAVLFRKAEKFEDTEILLVKEFRSPVRNSKGFVYENPGGSSFKSGQDPIKVVSDEVCEETGLCINPGRFACFAPRQVAATLSTHVAYLFAAELTKEEMDQAKESAKSNMMFGNIEDSEQTYLYITTVKELMDTILPVDWSMFGMIMRALL